MFVPHMHIQYIYIYFFFNGYSIYRLQPWSHSACFESKTVIFYLICETWSVSFYLWTVAGERRDGGREKEYVTEVIKQFDFPLKQRCDTSIGLSNMLRCPRNASAYECVKTCSGWGLSVPLCGHWAWRRRRRMLIWRCWMILGIKQGRWGMWWAK